MYQVRDLVGAGAKVFLNLEWEAADAPSIDYPGISFVRIRDFEPLPYFAPSLADDHVIRALAFIRRGPPIIYVHCRSGQNRTGVVVAAYKIIEKDEYAEAVITEFRRYKGFWGWADAGYIRSIGWRRVDLRRRVDELERTYGRP